MMRLEKRRFIERVDYITSPGYLSGYDSRKETGLLGEGPSAVITDKAIFRFDETTKEMYLESIHPGVTVQQVREAIDWDLKVAGSVLITEPPSPEELKIIKILDPQSIYTGDGLQTITFESYILRFLTAL